MPLNQLYIGFLQLPGLARLAAMSAAILLCESLLFRRRAEHLAIFSVLEDDLIAALQDLKGLRHLLRMVELDRLRLAEYFEISGIDEIAHLDAVHGKTQFL